MSAASANAASFFDMSVFSDMILVKFTNCMDTVFQSQQRWKLYTPILSVSTIGVTLGY